MPFSVRYREDFHVVETVFTGVIQEQDIHEELAESHRLASQHQTYRFLADLTEAVVQLSVFGVYELPDVYEQLGGERPVRVALILPKDPGSRDTATFFQTIALNRGWTVAIFSNAQEALAWLQGS